MTAMAEVIDESIKNMSTSMVTKADQEKVCALLMYPCLFYNVDYRIASINTRRTSILHSSNLSFS